MVKSLLDEERKVLQMYSASNRFVNVQTSHANIMTFQELLAVCKQMSGQIHAKAVAAPQQALPKVMEEIHGHNETVAAKSQRELEGWFHTKVHSYWSINDQSQIAASF